MPVQTSVFDEKTNVKQYSVSNSKGTLVVKVIDYGAVITNILFADNKNNTLDLVLGYDTFDGYISETNPHFGAVMGRVANRIAKGVFNLNDTKYQLDLNDNGVNTLHGGVKGFDKNKWTMTGSTENSVSLELISNDGDQHFPGSIRVGLTYTVTEENELKLEYTAQLLSDSFKDTIINLTNHSYFNLNGCSTDEGVLALNHKLRMNSDQYLEVNEAHIPSGKLVSTKSTPSMDFSGNALQTLSDKIPKLIDGFDHCYVIRSDTPVKYDISGGALLEAAVVTSPLTGITLTFSTTEPGFQFYTANNLNNTYTTKKSQSAQPLKLATHSALCFEAQRFPDAINHNDWRNQVILSPMKTYKQKTVYKFSH